MQSSQQSIINAFNSQTYVKSQMDVQHTPLYDTVTIAAAGSVTQTTASFFTNVGTSSAKTLAQTNLGSNKELQAPEAFSIFAIRVRIGENITYADFIAIMNGFALQFWIGNKWYNLAPIWHYNAGGGIFGSGSVVGTAVSSATSTVAYTNGYPSREGMHKLAIPIVIENKAQFYAQFVGNAYTLVAAGGSTFGTGLTAQLLLDGLYARGVQ